MLSVSHICDLCLHVCRWCCEISSSGWSDTICSVALLVMDADQNYCASHKHTYWGGTTTRSTVSKYVPLHPRPALPTILCGNQVICPHYSLIDSHSHLLSHTLLIRYVSWQTKSEIQWYVIDNSCVGWAPRCSCTCGVLEAIWSLVSAERKRWSEWGLGLLHI